MRVMINESRSDDPAVGVDRAPGRGIGFADPHNLSFMHRYIGLERGLAGAIRDTCILDQQVVRHGFFSLFANSS
jgi:hypothetical protein